MEVLRVLVSTFTPAAIVGAIALCRSARAERRSMLLQLVNSLLEPEVQEGRRLIYVYLARYPDRFWTDLSDDEATREDMELISRALALYDTAGWYVRTDTSRSARCLRIGLCRSFAAGIAPTHRTFNLAAIGRAGRVGAISNGLRTKLRRTCEDVGLTPPSTRRARERHRAASTHVASGELKGLSGLSQAAVRTRGLCGGLYERCPTYPAPSRRQLVNRLRGAIPARPRPPSGTQGLRQFQRARRLP